MHKHTWRLLAAASLSAPLLSACGTRDDSAMNDSAAGTVAMTDSTGISTQGSVNDMSAGATDASLVSFVALVNQSEIEAGTLASTKARQSDVKKFAQSMVDGHQKAMQELRDLSSRSGWVMPDTGSGSANMGTGTGSGTTGGSTSGNAAGTTGNTAGGQTGGMASGSAGSTGNAAGSGGMLSSTMTQLQQSHQASMQTLRGATGATFDRTYMDGQVAAHQQVLDVLRQYNSSIQNAELRTQMSAMEKDVETHLRQAQEIVQKLGTTS